MAHEIDMSNDRANVAWVGRPPWHQLGEELEENAPLEVWAEKAGLEWDALESPLYYPDKDGLMNLVPDRKVLSRSDNGAVLSVVSDNYRTVQPIEVLEFYRSLVDSMGFKLDVAGSLRGGKKVWALAKTGETAIIKGKDRIEDNILCATGFDGNTPTIATRCSIRVVCMNTFRMAVGEDGARADIRVPHHAVFNADQVKAQLGLETNAWSDYVDHARELAGRKVKLEEAVDFFVNLFYGSEEEIDIENAAVKKRIQGIVNVYQNGVGQNTASANGTAWGLVNAVTRFADHERTVRDAGNRLDSAWFGQYDRVKQSAWNSALKLVA